MRHLKIYATVFFIIFITTMSAALATGVYLDALLHPHISCAFFHTRSDAMRAYTAGATWLDRDGDGIPCEKLA